MGVDANSKRSYTLQIYIESVICELKKYFFFKENLRTNLLKSSEWLKMSEL